MAEQFQDIKEKEIVPDEIRKGLNEFKIWIKFTKYIKSPFDDLYN